MASKATGTSGTLYLYYTWDSVNTATRTYTVRVRALIENRSSPTFTYDKAWSINPWGASGTFTINGVQTITVYNGTTTLTLNAAGDAYGTSQTFTMGATGTSGLGGPTSVSESQTLPAIKVLPNAPTGLTATRVSDTQVRLDWSQTSPSNGAVVNHIIQRRKNQPAGVGAEVGWDSGTVISPSTTATVSVAPNEQWQYRVWARNAQGQRVSNNSNIVYTTPAAPTGVAAAKLANQDIKVTFTSNVDYESYNHEVWHGTVTGGVTTWDGAALATLAAGTFEYTHTAPDPTKVHIYQVRAKQGTLYSTYAQSNQVQLLVAPNKPTVPAMGAFADKAVAFTFGWTHNSQDTTPQSAYEFAYSTNGGTTWTSSGKVASTASTRVLAANTFAANAAVQMRVRTWGQATTGGSDGTGASPWSDVKTVTFKTRPVATITAPANGATLNDSTVRVNLTFSQAEGATFVKAELKLNQTTGGTVLLETLETTQLIGTKFATPVDNATAYNVQARVLDSNGIWSGWKTNAFSVTYLPPVLPVVATQYLEETGWGQIDLTIPDPGAGQAAAATVTITRSIDGGPEEVIVQDFPTAALLSFFDTTPTIHGSNRYTITVTSPLGAQRSVLNTLVTQECRRAFLSKGNGYNSVVVFGANLKVNEALSVASDTVQAAGRTKPIGLYGVETNVQLKVSSFIFERDSYSTLPELRSFLLVPGKACYRDASGRRVFGSVKGSVQYYKTTRGDLSFTMTETS